MKTEVFLAQASPTKTTAPKQEPIRPGTLNQPPPAPLLWSPFRGELGQRSELILLVVVIAACAVVLFGWALIFRKPSSRTLSSRRPGSSGGRRRKRSSGPSQPEHRNPTLKERGGLPPVRPEPPP